MVYGSRLGVQTCIIDLVYKPAELLRSPDLDSVRNYPVHFALAIANIFPDLKSHVWTQVAPASQLFKQLLQGTEKQQSTLQRLGSKVFMNTFEGARP